jgi:hypothetical protein
LKEINSLLDDTCCRDKVSREEIRKKYMWSREGVITIKR